MAEKIIEQTKRWLEDIVIGLNFCPFAKKEYVNNTISYHVTSVTDIEAALHELAAQCQQLMKNDKIETSLIIFSQGFADFDNYLDLLELANQLLADLGYEGRLQLASFHPDYCFDGVAMDDTSNFTNRSPYPMLHLIREDSIAEVLKFYPEPDTIPENNINKAHELGAEFFQPYLKK